MCVWAAGEKFIIAEQMIGKGEKARTALQCLHFDKDRRKVGEDSGEQEANCMLSIM